MTQANTRQLVQEALDQGWVIYEEMKAARAIAQQARDHYNQVKARASSDEMQQEGEAKLAAQVKVLDAARDKTIAAAQVKLNLATDVFNRAKETAMTAHNREMSQASDAWAVQLRAEKQKLNLLAAEAQAEAHTAEQRANVLAASLERFKAQTKQKLGVDLGTLLETA